MHKILTPCAHILFALVCMTLLLSCGGSERQIRVSDAGIFGAWKENVAIADGSYSMRYVDNKSEYKLTLAVKLNLLQVYGGDTDAATGTFVLLPVTKDGEQITNKYFIVSSIEKFNDFIIGELGSTAMISFSYTADSKKDALTVLKNCAGFEGVSLREGVKIAATASYHVIAVLPVDASVSGDLAVSVRNLTNQGLLQHKDSKKFRLVDTSQIDKIATQHQFELSDWSNPHKVAEIGKALNADMICIVHANGYYLTGDTPWRREVSVSMSFLDINTMEVLGVFSNTYKASRTDFKIGQTRQTLWNFDSNFPRDVSRIKIAF